MKRNINTIQNTDDTILANATERYIIEALANLGQRYSIKGDGISVRVNTLGKLIPEFDQDPTQYIVKVEKTNENSILFKLLHNDSILNGEAEASFSIDLDNGANIDSYSCIVNETDIKSFSKLYMYSTTNYFIYSGVQKFDDNLDNNMFVCEKYDKYTNTLSSSLKLYKYSYMSGYNFIILYLYKYSSNLYYLNIYHLYANEEDFINSVADFANHPDKPAYSFSPESFLSELYAQYKSNSSWNWLKHETQVQLANSTNHSIVVYHVNYNPNNGSYIVDSNLNNYTEELIEGQTFGSDTFTDPILFDTVYGVDKQIETTQYSQTYIYRKLKEEYSDQIFKSNANSTNTSYETLFKNVLKGLFLSSYNGQPLYIPLDYEFEYTYNTNDEWQMYYSAKDICIHDVAIISESSSVTNTEILNTILQYKDKSGIVRLIDKTTNDVEKSTFYSFYVEPDPENTSNIYSINVSKHFTMPYISPTGYWVVDDIETAIYARGKDAGNPNITIVKSDPDVHDTPTILSGGDKNYLESLDWCTEEATIKLPKRIIRNGNEVSYEQMQINHNETFDCYYFVPDLTKVQSKKLEEHVDKLKYCILLNLSSVKSIKDYNPVGTDDFSKTIRQIYGEDGIIMTFWTLVYEDGQYKFAPIERDNVAVDIDYMTNLYNIIGYAITNYIPNDPDNYMFTHLVFDNVNYLTKNRGTNSEANFPAYPVIKTVSAISDQSNQNLNNFNLKIEYNDTVVGSYYYTDEQGSFNATLDDGSPDPNDNANKSYTYLINSISQSESRRWFDNWKDNASSSTITNENYTYTVGNDTFAYLEYLPNSINNSVPMLDLSEIFIKDNTSLNKVNIVSFDKDANMYYSYIGTSHDTEDKTYLTIGTAKQNINIGTATLVDEHKEMFDKQAEMHIEFDNTRITSYAYIQNDLITEKDTITYGTTWRKFVIPNVNTYWTTTFRQTGFFESSYAYLCAAGNECVTNLEEFFNGDNAFIAMTVSERYKKQDNTTTLPFDMYINDMVSVPNLIKTISPRMYDAFNSYNVEVVSDNDVISYCKNNNVSYIGVRLNSSMQKDVYSLDNNKISTNIDNTKIFVSNELQISYYVSDNKYYLTINDMTNNDNMTYIHKLKNMYNA